jgi:hypothetical protein
MLRISFSYDGLSCCRPVKNHEIVLVCCFIGHFLPFKFKNLDGGSESGLRLAAEFRSKTFRGICSEQLPLFRGRKCSFRGIPKFTEESIPKLGTEGNSLNKK